MSFDAGFDGAAFDNAGFNGASFDAAANAATSFDAAAHTAAHGSATQEHDFSTMIDRLQRDESFVKEFLTDPNKVIDQAKLTGDQKVAVNARDVNDLVKLQQQQQQYCVGTSKLPFPLTKTVDHTCGA